jgi:hypothetical protein
LGRKVATLTNNEIQSPGEYSVQWNAIGLPSGVYFYRLCAVEQNGILPHTETRKMLLIK